MSGSPLILHLETGTEVCSVALSRGQELLQEAESAESFQHANTLIPFIKEVLSKGNQSLDSLDAISVGLGPGSYTGLRIGLSTAKGLCYGLDIRLLGISSLRALAAGAKSTRGKVHDQHYCAMIDARRNEAYTAIYNAELEVVSDPVPSVIDIHFVASMEKYKELIFCGNAVHKLDSFFDKNHHKLLSLRPKAKNSITLALKQFSAQSNGDLNFITESYLKQPHITKPKNKL